MSFPERLSEITVAWLNEVLTKKYASPPGRVRSFDAEPIARQGVTSTIYLITLTYDREPHRGPDRLIAKFSSDNEAVREALAANRGYQREVGFYLAVGDDAGIPVPRCYAACYDAASNRCLLVLDYIDNTCERDVFSGTVADIELAVRHLAAFHARWWGKEGALTGFTRGMAPFLVELYAGKLTDSLNHIRTRYRDQVGPTLISLLELWLENTPLFARYFQRGPLTLCHGDFHRNQLLFPITDGDPFCVIDWQLVCIDSGPTDLAHIIVTGLLPDQRRQKEREIVEEYHRLLLAGGVRNHSRDDTWLQYRLGIVKLALFYLSAFAIGDVQPMAAWWDADATHAGTPFWDVLCTWPSRAMEEHGVLDLLAEIVRREGKQLS